MTTAPTVTPALGPGDDVGHGARDARRHAARPHPHPVGQSATARCPGRRDPRRALPRGAPHPSRPPAGVRRARPGSRLRPCAPARRRDGRRAVPAPVAPRCRTRGRGPLEPRPVRRGRRRRLRLRPRRRRHEGDDRPGARRDRAAGRGGARRRPRPATDPIPGLRRDVLFTCTADEEAGSLDGARWIAEHRPEWLQAAGAVNECGGVSVTVAGKRLYPIQVAEKGFAPYRIHITGTWGHGSMPRADNAAVLAARAIERLAVPGPVRSTPVMARFLEAAADALPGEPATVLRRIAAGEMDEAAADAAIDGVCDPMYARAASGPDPRHAESRHRPRRREVQRHSRRRGHRGRLPGPARHHRTDDAGRGRAPPRPRPLPACESSSRLGEPVESPADGPLWDILVQTCAITTPTRSRCRSWRPSPPTRRHGDPRCSDLRLLTAPPRPGRTLPRAVPWRRRARFARGASLRAAGPLRRGPPLLR